MFGNKKPIDQCDKKQTYIQMLQHFVHAPVHVAGYCFLVQTM